MWVSDERMETGFDAQTPTKEKESLGVFDQSPESLKKKKKKSSQVRLFLSVFTFWLTGFLSVALSVLPNKWRKLSWNTVVQFPPST